jgi:HEPN domain-containing protein
MKNNEDVARGWIIKAENDIINLTLMMESGIALDTACFHAQQAAEKYLKAFLCFNNVAFPKTHNIDRLLSLCAMVDKQFSDLVSETIFLTDYAVELRYDLDFYPEDDEVETSLKMVNKIKSLVLSLLPETLTIKEEAGK